MTGAAVYLDLDGTLFGPGGSLLRGAGGVVSDAATRALLLLHEREVPVVLVSGRSASRLETSARILGASGMLAELGACDCGYPTAPGQTVHEAIAATGIVAELLHREPGLSTHPGALWGRQGSHVLRGVAGAGAAEWVRQRSGGTLRLAHNGRVAPDTHIYHLLPAAASKAMAVARDLATRGVDPAGCLAVGDSAEDMAMGEHVGHCALVRNGAEADPQLGARTAWVTRGSYGEGTLEAVRHWLGLGD